jgi:hypothetical protein
MQQFLEGCSVDYLSGLLVYSSPGDAAPHRAQKQILTADTAQV